MNTLYFDRTLSDLLIAEGILSRPELERLLGERENATESVADMLVRAGVLTEAERARYLARQLGLPFIHLATCKLDNAAVRLLSSALCLRLQVLPIERGESSLSVAMSNPLDVAAIDEMRSLTGLEIDPVIATRGDIQEAVSRVFGAYDTLGALVVEAGRALATGDSRSELEEEEGLAAFTVDETGLKEQAPIVRLVNEIVLRAVNNRASDIHLNPEKDRLRIRFRVDGMLHEVTQAPRDLQNSLISRIKIMAGMDIAERRAPQDGRITLMLRQAELDFRVSTYPSLHGENVVLRILDKRQARIGLEQLGMQTDTLSELQQLIHHPYGMVLVCGPTGSGKTTTLYSCLNTLNSVDRNIMTIEDPVEYQMAGIIQGNVNVKAGVTFASGLRTLVRQDPDVILVGEIRDAETAKIAIEAALTGHLVFSTIHANDAAGAVTRLIEMGVEPFLIASALLVSLNQRLMRLICVQCGKPCAPTAGALTALGIPETDTAWYATIRRGSGCDSCSQSGYRGRLGVYEMLVMDGTLQRLIVSRSTSQEIKQAALRGRRTLREDALLKLQQGLTTPEEVLRITAL